MSKFLQSVRQYFQKEKASMKEILGWLIISTIGTALFFRAQAAWPSQKNPSGSIYTALAYGFPSLLCWAWVVIRIIRSALADYKKWFGEEKK